MHALALLSVVAATLGQPPVDFHPLSHGLQLRLERPGDLQVEAPGVAPASPLGEAEAGAGREAPSAQRIDRRTLAGQLFFISVLSLAGAIVAPDLLINRWDSADQGGMAATVMVQVGLFGASGFAAALGFYQLARAE